MVKLLQPYHLVTISPWPILISFIIIIILINIVNFFHNYNYSYLLIYLIIINLCLFEWWRDVIRESFKQGYHTSKVIKGIKLGIILFIISEVFFFISIFWCYLHIFLSPSIDIGLNWPPKNILGFNPYYIPLLNTIILLSSGITITWCHYSIFLGKKFNSIIRLFITLVLAIFFTIIQYYEYQHSSFSISDSVYGSIFYIATGFHGFHVIIGTLFLFINFIRIFNNNFSSIHHLGFEIAAWYWHFVDIVWLFLYLIIYLWSI